MPLPAGGNHLREAVHVHLFTFLTEPPETLPPVCVFVGDDAFLRRLARRAVSRLLDHDADTPLDQFDGTQVQWRDVADELCTASLFGPSQRIVFLEDADKFVSDHRAQLESYVAAPSDVSRLILCVRAFPGNTRLAKLVREKGLQVDCKLPERAGRDKRKNVDLESTARWLTNWAAEQHQLTLRAGAAERLLELSQNHLGLADQGLAKLALLSSNPQAVTPEGVVEWVGGWRATTTWDFLDALCVGDAAQALGLLERLLSAGEHPVGLFGAVSWSLRRFVRATREVEQQEASGERPQLARALRAAEIKDFPPGTLAKVERQLRQIGRDRADRLAQWLLEIDLSLKVRIPLRIAPAGRWSRLCFACVGKPNDRLAL